MKWRPMKANETTYWNWNTRSFSHADSADYGSQKLTTQFLKIVRKAIRGKGDWYQSFYERLDVISKKPTFKAITLVKRWSFSLLGNLAIVPSFSYAIVILWIMKSITCIRDIRRSCSVTKTTLEGDTGCREFFQKQPPRVFYNKRL